MRSLRKYSLRVLRGEYISELRIGFFIMAHNASTFLDWSKFDYLQMRKFGYDYHPGIMTRVFSHRFYTARHPSAPYSLYHKNRCAIWDPRFKRLKFTE